MDDGLLFLCGQETIGQLSHHDYGLLGIISNINKSVLPKSGQKTIKAQALQKTHQTGCVFIVFDYFCVFIICPVAKQ